MLFIFWKKKDNFYIKYIANAFQTSLSSLESGDNGGLSEAVRTMVGNIRSWGTGGLSLTTLAFSNSVFALLNFDFNASFSRGTNSMSSSVNARSGQMGWIQPHVQTVFWMNYWTIGWLEVSASSIRIGVVSALAFGDSSISGDSSNVKDSRVPHDMGELK